MAAKLAVMSDRISVIISQPRGDDGRPRDESLRRLLDSLAERTDVEVVLVPYLADLSTDGPVMQRLRATDGQMLVVGPFQARAIHWLLAKNGLDGLFVELEPDADPSGLGIKTTSGSMTTVWCLGLRTGDPLRICEACLNEIARRMGKELERGESERGESERGERPQPCRIEEATRRRWYPVIDRDRCTNCLECLNFCLFGVYGLDESELLAIDQPDACRPGCPACSRICPSGAIIFPEHNDPAISGDPHASSGGLKPDLLQLLGGDGPSSADLDSLVDGLDELDL
jgi:hypothetical protein